MKRKIMFIIPCTMGLCIVLRVHGWMDYFLCVIGMYAWFIYLESTIDIAFEVYDKKIDRINEQINNLQSECNDIQTKLLRIKLKLEDRNIIY